MFEWHIQSRAHKCQKTGKPFEDGEVFHTVLLHADEAYERLDLSTEAWKESCDEILSRPGYVSHWKGKYHQPPAAAPEAIRKGDAEVLLRELVALGNPDYGAALFILAVMLERKRVLRVKQQVQEVGHRIFIYEHPRSGDVFMIRDPELQLDQLETVQSEVGRLLEEGLPATELVAASGEPVEEPFNPSSEVSTLAPA